MLTDFFNNLPEVLQENTFLYILAICWAAGYFTRSISKWITNEFRQWIILFVGIEAAVFEIHPWPRAIGMGFICAMVSMPTYDLVLAQLETKLRAAFGLPTPPLTISNPTPLTLQPGVRPDLQTK